MRRQASSCFIARLLARLLAMAPFLIGGGEAFCQNSPAHVVVGRVCIDQNEDGRCAPSEPPLVGATVRSSEGAQATTDTKGLYHLATAAVGYQSSTSSLLGPSADFFVQRHFTLQIEHSGLGPGATLPKPAWIQARSGGLSRLDLAVGPPHWQESANLALKPGRKVVQREGALWVVVERQKRTDHVWKARRGGLVEGEKLLIPLSRRRDVAFVTDLASNGRMRLYRIEVRIVPRNEGGDLLVVDPPKRLLTLDLPAPSERVAPGPLRIPLQANSDVKLRFAGHAVRLDSNGHAALEAELVPNPPKESDPNRLSAKRRKLSLQMDDLRKPLVIILPVQVDSQAADAGALSVDLRANGTLSLAGGIATPGAALDGSVQYWLHRHFFGGILEANGFLPETALRGLIPVDGRTLPQIQLVDSLGTASWRAPLDVVQVELGDEAATAHPNGSRSLISARWKTPSVEVGFGVTNMGVKEGKKDVKERAGALQQVSIGPWAKLKRKIGPLTLKGEGAVAAASVPRVQGLQAQSGHMVFTETGGSVFTLPSRHIVEGSERIQIEVQDSQSGRIYSRHMLDAETDYFFDVTTGRVVLARPLTLYVLSTLGQTSALAGSTRARLIVDYAFIPSDPQERELQGAATAEVSAQAGGGEGTLRAATRRGGQYGLVAFNTGYAKADWLQLSSSIAVSRGIAFSSGAFGLSVDGGLSTTTVDPSGVFGGAATVNADVSKAGQQASFWGAARSKGYSDQNWQGGAMAQAGAATSLHAFGVTLSAQANGQTGAVNGTAYESQTPQSTTSFQAIKQVDAAFSAIRIERQVVGPLSLALESQVEHGRVRTENGTNAFGGAAAIGAEATWQTTPNVALIASHLQSFPSWGTGVFARDPRFSALGVRVKLAKETVEMRVGLDAAFRPVGRLRWAHQAGQGTAWGGVSSGTGRPWERNGNRVESGVTQQLGHGARLFTQTRLRDLDATGPNQVGSLGKTAPLKAQQIVGSEVKRGRLQMSAMWIRNTTAPLAGHSARESLRVRGGYRSSGLQLGGFTEVLRPTAGGRSALDGLALQSGISARLQLFPALKVGGGGVVVAVPGQSQLRGQLHAGFAFRPQGASWVPAVIGAYNARQLGPTDPVFTSEPTALQRRVQAAQLSAAFGHAGGWSLELTGAGRLSEPLYEPLSEQMNETSAISKTVQQRTSAATTNLRLAIPLGRFEAAMQIGMRLVDGGQGPLELDGTARGEALVVLGATRVGLGVVLAGYAGSGLEEIGEGAPQKVYAVFRGVL